jgi:hypothetical protein
MLYFPLLSRDPLLCNILSDTESRGSVDTIESYSESVINHERHIKVSDDGHDSNNYFML